MGLGVTAIMNKFVGVAIIALMVVVLDGCTSTRAPRHSDISLKDKSYLQQGERFFEVGYYKRAMRLLLPLASDGNAQAQYAVGYMYYYGYGVAQDPEIGSFWIQRAANRGYPQAIKALQIIAVNKRTPPKGKPA